MSLRLFATVILWAAALVSTQVADSLRAGAQDSLPAIADEQEKADDNPDLVEAVPAGALWRFGAVGKGLAHRGFYRLAYSDDGRLLAARNQQNEVIIIEVATRRRLCTVANEDSIVLGVGFSPDNQFFLASAPGESVPLRIFNSRTGALEKEIGSDISHAHFSQDGKYLFALGAEQVQTIAWPTGEVVASRRWLSEPAKRHFLSRDGKRVVASLNSINRGRPVWIYDVESRSKLQLRGSDKSKLVKSVAISPDNLWVALVYHRESHVQLWDLRAPSASYMLTGHQRPVQAVSFSHDSRFLITTSWDKTALVWDVPSKKKIGQLAGHTENVNSSAFAPLAFEVTTGASGGTDNSLIVWDLWELLFPDFDLPIAFQSFEIVWKEMGTEDPRQSLKATKALIDREGDWIKLLANKVGARSQSANTEAVEALIERLSHHKFAVREAAMQQLIKIRAVAEKVLLQALEQGDLSAEARHRVLKVLNQPIERPSMAADELRRLQRCVLALELIETEAAIGLLKQIEVSHINVDIARAAAAARERIARRQQLAGERPIQ